jgi:hypothetical protein
MDIVLDQLRVVAGGIFCGAAFMVIALVIVGAL